MSDQTTDKTLHEANTAAHRVAQAALEERDRDYERRHSYASGTLGAHWVRDVHERIWRNSEIGEALDEYEALLEADKKNFHLGEE